MTSKQTIVLKAGTSDLTIVFGHPFSSRSKRSRCPPSFLLPKVLFKPKYFKISRNLFLQYRVPGSHYFVAGRRIAYIMYFVPKWDINDGGHRDRFDRDENGCPKNYS